MRNLSRRSPIFLQKIPEFIPESGDLQDFRADPRRLTVRFGTNKIRVSELPVRGGFFYWLFF